MSAPTYIELVNAVRRAHDVLHERRYYERVIRVDDSPALHEPHALVALGVEIADLCRRIGPTPADPDVCPHPRQYSSVSGLLPCSWCGPIPIVRVCPRCAGPDDHGDECQTESERKRMPIPTARTWDVEHDR